jgi:hypothetical protein
LPKNAALQTGLDDGNLRSDQQEKFIVISPRIAHKWQHSEKVVDVYLQQIIRLIADIARDARDGIWLGG